MEWHIICEPDEISRYVFCPGDQARAKKIAFYAPRDPNFGAMLKEAGVVSVEMESDTLFILGAYRGWRTGALYTSDGAPGVIKPEWGEADYQQGEQNVIKIALEAMWHIAQEDGDGGRG